MSHSLSFSCSALNQIKLQHLRNSFQFDHKLIHSFPPSSSSSSCRFDVLVNGGGAVTLQFQRSPFRPLTRTVFVPWNQVSNYAPIHPPPPIPLSIHLGRPSGAAAVVNSRGWTSSSWQAVVVAVDCRRFNLPQPERFVLIILQFHPYLDRGSAAGADAAQRGRWTAYNEVIRL